MTEQATVNMDGERFDIVMEAAFEVEAIGEQIRNASKGAPDGLEYLFRGVGLRISELSNIIMAAMSDQAETTDELAGRLRGEREVDHG